VASVQASGQRVEDHFVDVHEMVEIGGVHLAPAHRRAGVAAARRTLGAAAVVLPGQAVSGAEPAGFG